MNRNKLTLKKTFSNPKEVIYNRLINKTKIEKKNNSNSNKIIKQLENNNDKIVASYEKPTEINLKNTNLEEFKANENKNKINNISIKNRNKFFDNKQSRRIYNYSFFEIKEQKKCGCIGDNGQQLCYIF